MKFPNIQPPFAGFASTSTVSSFSPECVGEDILPQANTFAIVNNWTANLLCFVPMILREPVLLSQFWWMNGNANNGNVAAGVYSEDGQTKIIATGSTAATGTSVIQIVDVTDTMLPANTRLWLAIGCDGTNRFVLSQLNAALGLTYLGVKQQASGWSSGLPTTISLNTPTQAVLPLFGFTKGVI